MEEGEVTVPEPTEEAPAALAPEVSDADAAKFKPIKFEPVPDPERILRRDFKHTFDPPTLAARDGLVDAWLDEGHTFGDVYRMVLEESRTNRRILNAQGRVVELRETTTREMLETLIDSTSYQVSARHYQRKRPNGPWYLLRSLDGGMLSIDDARLPEEMRLSPEAVRYRDWLITAFRALFKVKFAVLRRMARRCLKRSEGILIVPGDQEYSLPLSVKKVVDGYWNLVSKVEEATLWGIDGQDAPLFLAEDGDVLTYDSEELLYPGGQEGPQETDDENE